MLNNKNFNSTEDKRINIYLSETPQLHIQSKITLLTLKSINKNIFTIGGTLVSLILKPELKIIPLNIYRLRHEICKCCKFIINKKNKKEIFPPFSVIQDAFVTGNEYFPEIKGISNHPVILSSGNIIYNSGYNKETGIYINNEIYSSFEELDKKEKINKEEIISAINQIDDIFSDFPFLTQSDRANFYALVITILCRTMINDLFPIFLIKSAAPGTGKTLLIKLIYLLLTGRLPNISVLPENESEIRKSIFAFLLNCSEAIILDNAKERISSATLASISTAGRYKARILQKTESAEIEVKIPIIITANNPDIDRELARRMVLIELLVEEENPAARNNFKYPDIKQKVIENRVELLNSFFVIIKHWINNNKQEETENVLGSFEKWSRIIGGILKNANINGFLDNFKSFFNQADNDNETIIEFINLWYKKYNDNEVFAKDLIEIAKETGFIENRSGSYQRIIGKALSKKINIVYNGFKIVKSSQVNRVQKWKIVKIRYNLC